METSEWRFHVTCPWRYMGEYEDPEGILTKVYRCEICGRSTERKSVFGRVARQMEEEE